MTLRIRWTDDAAADLQNHLDYILERNPRAAARLAERVLATEKLICDWPQAAPFDGALGVHECWIAGSRLKLIYHIEGDTIEIVAAFHTSRDPEGR